MTVTPIKGRVSNVGGGFVEVFVSRDTENYPEPGTDVVIAQAEQLKAKDAEIERLKGLLPDGPAYPIPARIVHIGWPHYRYEVTFSEPHLVIDMGPIAADADGEAQFFADRNKETTDG